MLLGEGPCSPVGCLALAGCREPPQHLHLRELRPLGGPGGRSSPLAGSTGSPRRNTEASVGIEGRGTPGARCPQAPWDLHSPIWGPTGAQQASEDPAEVAQLVKTLRGQPGACRCFWELAGALCSRVPTPCNESMIHPGVTGGDSCFSRAQCVTRAGLQEPLLAACQEPCSFGGIRGGVGTAPRWAPSRGGAVPLAQRGAPPAEPPSPVQRGCEAPGVKINEQK